MVVVWNIYVRHEKFQYILTLATFSLGQVWGSFATCIVYV